MRTLDFNQIDSYKNANDIRYGDLNHNGKEESIKEELTNKSGCGFTPIGDRSNNFSGVFDGNEHTIKNLYINISNSTYMLYVGLFGYVKNGEINNLGIVGGNIIGNISFYSSYSDCYVGGIAGYLYKSNISNCYNLSNIITSNDIDEKGSSYAGGIVGYLNFDCSIINCYNKANINSNCNSNRYSYAGGITAYSSMKIINCYNTGTIIGNGGTCKVGGITAELSTGGAILTNCCNIGNVIGNGSKGNYVGGIAGYFSSKDITNSYNTGIITSNNGSSTSYVGGIAGYSTANIRNSYNTGDITASNNSNTIYAGGIVGYIYSNLSSIINCFCTGSVKCINENRSYAGGIAGYISSTSNNNYYLDTINIVGKSICKNGKAVSELYMLSIDFYNALNVDNTWVYKKNEYPILLNEIFAKVSDSTEITIENTIKKFKITTEVLAVDGEKGGTITGEGNEAFETVLIYESNKNEIVMIPYEGYGISNITINGLIVDYKVSKDGSYKIPVGYFENIQEDKHIVVTFSPLDQILTINKVDEDNISNFLEGAKLKVEQIDERQDITNDVSEMISNGKEFDVPNKEGGIIENVKGELNKSNGDYFFVEENCRYIPTNGKTYQLAHGGASGIKSTTANSYMQIDLTGKEGKYVVVVNAEVSSESFDYGYATINKTMSPAPTRDVTEGRFIYISGTKSATDYTSAVLEGGEVYYLHLGYYKDSSSDKDEDQVVFNSINIYEVTRKSFDFAKIEEKYIPKNIQQTNTVAN